MANVQSQFGFQDIGTMSGKAASFGLRAPHRRIAYNYGTAIYKGDPVVSLSNGTIGVATSQSVQLAGVFLGCEYYDPVQKITLKSKYWPAPSGLNSATIVRAYVIDDPDTQFVVASLGSTRAIALSDIDNNIQWAAGAGGNATSGLSSFVIDDGNINTTNTLPFKIVDLYSTVAAPGQNGADDSSIYNWAIVQMNFTDRSVGRLGI